MALVEHRTEGTRSLGFGPLCSITIADVKRLTTSDAAAGGVGVGDRRYVEGRGDFVFLLPHAGVFLCISTLVGASLVPS